MKKINFLIVLLSFSICFTNVQGFEINTTGTSLNAPAMQDITSSVIAMPVPKMNKAAVLVINTPAKGLLVYDTS